MQADYRDVHSAVGTSSETLYESSMSTDYYYPFWILGVRFSTDYGTAFRP